VNADELAARIPVTTLAEAKRARVALRDRAAAALGRTRASIRFPQSGTPMYTQAEGGLAVCAYADEQDAHIRRSPGITRYIGLSRDVQAGIRALAETHRTKGSTP